ncbi:MAG: PIN domain-containing protein [Armatimonadota bacterium]|nr:PIN domain-containing protein [bacterium]MDW8321267.1 PIN domain-containing protein [Armatimonadota bacterium]
MYRVFLDASVYIAGAGSSTGGSRQILDWCALRLLQPFTCAQVLQEVRRNVSTKLPRASSVLEQIIGAVGATVITSASEELTEKALELLPAKDAAAWACVVVANVDFFITLDRKHFKQTQVVENSPFDIVLPSGFAATFRAELRM